MEERGGRREGCDGMDRGGRLGITRTRSGHKTACTFGMQSGCVAIWRMGMSVAGRLLRVRLAARLLTSSVYLSCTTQAIGEASKTTCEREKD
jgi:hypothetical protein